MREEIVVLRKAVAEAGVGGGQTQGGVADGVPRETYENLQREKEELEEVVKQKEKRLMRLKSVRLIYFYFAVGVSTPKLVLFVR